MITFPTILYRCPGEHQCNGGTFDWMPVKDSAEFDAAIGDGWHKTLYEAMNPLAEEKIIPADDAPPTREEMEEKARELNIPFNKRTSDEIILTRITEALNVLDEKTAD